MSTDLPNPTGIDFSQALKILTVGELTETRGLLPWGSNFTYLLSVSYGGQEVLAVYKPRRGERPLWDFPEGTLYQREIAAFVVSEALGWHIVPPTILRDGPQGIGMMQLYINHNPDQHYFTFGPEHKNLLMRMALFDLVINNADRKGGHCLLDTSGERIWAIDHGVSFHSQPKLRTVIWDFAGKPIPRDLLEATCGLLEELASKNLRAQLNTLLSSREIDALFGRTAQLVELGVYPEPSGGRQYPWPPV